MLAGAHDLCRMIPIKTGLLGGSFNPAHRGHRHISRCAMNALGLDEVWWLVSPGNPLKPDITMAPLPVRLKSAHEQARGAPIVPTAIERELGTRYTVDTLLALILRYPRRQFVWLMGADNLAQFHLWRKWRTIACTMPIAVIARPGYNNAAMVSPAMSWLRRHQTPAACMLNRGNGSAPTLSLLRFSPDPRSATAIRGAAPDWASRYANFPPRDRLTCRLVHGETESVREAGE